MTSDYYSILGVNPTAEEVVIGAAYRALMRHYHPDTNPDPAAQARAREITVAYAVLRDPAKRAEYDAQRAADADLWSPADDDAPHRPPPAMRTVGIASAALALTLVGVAWTYAENHPVAERPATAQHSPPEPVRAPADATYPVVQLEPESERLARLREEAEILHTAPAPATSEVAPPDPPVIAPAAATPPPGLRPSPAARRIPPPSRPSFAVRAGSAKTPRPANNERLAALDTMAAGFLKQSMANAKGTKRDLLENARDRSAAARKACRSDACVADAYVRQIRETSAIMEGRPGPPK